MDSKHSGAGELSDFAVAIISHLLHVEGTLLATIEDFAPETLALQSRRVGELRYLLGRLTVASARALTNSTDTAGGGE